MLLPEFTYADRDLSWLDFNGRVLREAANPAVPLYERIRFMAIFSANLDEFFRVRVSALLTVNALAGAGTRAAGQLLLDMQALVQQHQEEFGRLLRDEILPQLTKEGVHLYYNEPLLAVHQPAVSDFFFSRVLAFLQSVWLSESDLAPIDLPDNALFFVVVLEPVDSSGERYALLPIPRLHLPRFYELPVVDGTSHLLFIDDIIRQHLPAVFPCFRVRGCYSIKINRNADVSIADEFAGEMDANVA